MPKKKPERRSSTRGAAASAVDAPSLRSLNPAQREAASALDGPVLVIAGAGTGKTRTLVHRLARLVETGVPAESILLLTFTRRAADEMIGRAAQLVGEGGGRAAGGTFHSFGLSLLRRFGRAVGLGERFTILDQADSFEVLAGLRAEADLRGRGSPRRETIGAILSKAVNNQVAVEDIVEREYPQFFAAKKELSEIAERYRAYKRERGLLDFDDLLVLLIELLKVSAEARRAIEARYRYVMVDEYQDTNSLQAEITRCLAGVQRNLMVVGDDAQSIYAFRGADFRNLFEFQRRFQDARVVTLEENYRSTQPILDVANGLMAQMAQSFRKTLRTAAPGAPGAAKPLLIEARDEPAQAAFVAGAIERLRAGGTPLGEIAVLFRASYHAFPLELELGRLKIPYVKYGGFKFMEAAHIKDVLAPLRVVQNPSDDVSLVRALLQCEGIGRTRARKIQQAVAGAADAKALAVALAGQGGRGKAKESLAPLVRLFESLHDARESPAACLTRAVAYYDPMIERQFDDWPKRKRDIEQLVAICHRYESLDTMLSDLTLEPPNTSSSEDALADPDARDRPTKLVLSTMHSAKGLEWRAVFVIQVLDGCIPMVSDFGFEAPDPDKLDEERRLLYVAVTRAKEQLTLSFPRATARGHGFGWASESRFLAALPPGLLDRQKAGAKGKKK